MWGSGTPGDLCDPGGVLPGCRAKGGQWGRGDGHRPAPYHSRSCQPSLPQPTAPKEHFKGLTKCQTIIVSVHYESPCGKTNQLLRWRYEAVFLHSSTCTAVQKVLLTFHIITKSLQLIQFIQNCAKKPLTKVFMLSTWRLARFVLFQQFASKLIEIEARLKKSFWS